MRCLICGNELKSCVCPDCGFDMSRCGEHYPSLDPAVPDRTPLWARRSAYYRALNDKIQSLTERVEELEKRPAVSSPEQPAPQQPESVRSTKKWECVCGCRNSMNIRYCANCGRITPYAKQDPTQVNAKTAPIIFRPRPNLPKATEKWECDCGCRNPAGVRYCKNCGQTKPN